MYLDDEFLDSAEINGKGDRATTELHGPKENKPKI